MAHRFNLIIEFTNCLIAPQAPDLFTANTASITKTYDRVTYFRPKLTGFNFEKFYQGLGTNSDYQKRLTDATDILISDYRDQLSLRIIKHALREAHEFVAANDGADLVAVFVLIISRYIKIGYGDNDHTAAHSLLTPWNEASNNLLPLFAALANQDARSIFPPKQHISFGKFNDDEEFYKRLALQEGSGEVILDLDERYKALLGN